MRAIVVGTKKNLEVIAEEFKIEGTDERFIVHKSIDIHHDNFVATHLETSQIIGVGETIDAAIAEGTRRWLKAPPELIAEKLAERRAWVAARINERAAATPP
jgi:hypothetical protein